MNKAPALSVLLAIALITGCSSSSDTKGGRGGRGEGGTPEVGYVVVQPTSVALTTELAGRTVPHAVSEIRPQVSGVIQKRLFTEGSLVHAGQTLYQIDPSLYRASAAQATASP